MKYCADVAHSSGHLFESRNQLMPSSAAEQQAEDSSSIVTVTSGKSLTRETGKTGLLILIALHLTSRIKLIPYLL